MSYSLLMAAPFNENQDDENNVINKKKQSHNKTKKVLPKDMFNMEKVSSVLEKIHNDSQQEDDKDNLGEFNPPPKPESVGVERTKHTTESMMNMTNEQNNAMFRTLGRAPQPTYNDNDNLELNNYMSNYGDAKSNEEYYKKMMSTFAQNQNQSQNPMNRAYYHSNHNNVHNNSLNQDDILMQKINYMINLLEEQQDEKTNNVTEEVVLYSFLGIFIIFIVDSFAKVGKYVR